MFILETFVASTLLWTTDWGRIDYPKCQNEVKMSLSADELKIEKLEIECPGETVNFWSFSNQQGPFTATRRGDRFFIENQEIGYFANQTLNLDFYNEYGEKIIVEMDILPHGNLGRVFWMADSLDYPRFQTHKTQTSTQ